MTPGIDSKIGKGSHFAVVGLPRLLFQAPPDDLFRLDADQRVVRFKHILFGVVTKTYWGNLGFPFGLTVANRPNPWLLMVSISFEVKTLILIILSHYVYKIYLIKTKKLWNVQSLFDFFK